MNKKQTGWHVAACVTVMALAGCATQVKQVAFGHEGQATQAEPVAVYFGGQPHPDVQRELGKVSYSVRVARGSSNQDAACHDALATAVQRLRQGARDRSGNAVVNVTTRFHSTRSDSSDEYTCGVSSTAAALAVQGDVVVLNAQ